MTDQLDDVPGTEECLVCFLERMLERFGCDGSLRWTSRWRKANASSAAGLERSMRAQGGFCDCEAVLNVFAAQSAIAGLTTH